MSIAAIDAATSPANGAQSAIARIAELQSLIAQAHGAPPPSATGASADGDASFTAALASANQTGALGAQQAAFGTPGAAALSGPGSNVNALAPAALGSVGGEPTPYDGLIVAAAQRHGIDPALLKGLIRAESNFDPSITSSAGAGGLVQLMPGTAASLGVSDRFDPAQSIEGGARYLRQQLDAFGGDVTKALAAYNAGPGAVQRYNGVPPYAETQAYVQKVQGYADEYRVAPAAPTTVPPSAPPPFATAAPTSLPPTTGSGSIT